jgi:protein-S-isoprenylcysteine O-methyltransferase Ste14
MITRLIIQTLAWIVAMAALLFVPAGTLRWPAAWVFLAEMSVLGLAGGLWLARHDPDLLRERLSPFVQRDQVASDRLIMLVFMLLFCAWLVFMGLDARRGHGSFVPVWLQCVGSLCVFLSVYVGLLTFRENSFAAPVVKIQRARGQRVITTGPYAVVRHPMYAGALLFFVGVPLLLGSWAGLIAVPVMTALLAIRIGVEERALSSELEGYAEYATRVRYRLLPRLW